jgi:predicted AAA+ superfamily ATPase
MQNEKKLFKRKIYDQMLRWKKESDGKTALLVKGAKRVGKSTIVEQFAKNEYKSFILINFASAPQEVHELFSDISDLNYLFIRLQLIFHVDLHERNSVIIFDEVQQEKRARQAIKFLVADHRYDYIETGSLISIRKNIEGISIPSEETRIQMFPMDWEEFLWATGDVTTCPLLEKIYAQRIGLGNDVQRRIMRYFRLYMLVGGMPQAVQTYLETNNFRMVDQAKREILDLYEEDFMKIDPSGKAFLIFDNIPAQLTGNATRYQASSVLGNPKQEKFSEIVNEMAESMTVNIAFHATDPAVGLSLSKSLSHFKIFLADTGLFVTLAFKDKSFTENIIYEKLLNDKLDVNLGYLYENIVAQMLKASGNELFYYTFPMENSTRSYEIDFLLSRGAKLCPIEVKSSGYKTHASLDAFSQKYASRILQRYLIYPKDFAKEQDILCIPVYMTPFL